MIQIERVSENVYVFTSELYAQVTAGAIVAPDFTVIIDTLPYPTETLELKDFVENRLGSHVRYVINTHYHADHTYGTCFFPGADVIAHARCRELLHTRGRAGLEAAKTDAPNLAEVEIVLPDVIFESGHFNLHVGRKTLTLTHSPGHSPDSITVLVREDRILFAADTMMSLPFIPDGEVDELIASLEMILTLELENVVQGHGEVVLRGEIRDAVKAQIKYLRTMRRKVVRTLEAGRSKDALRKFELEDFNWSNILLGGLVTDLHWRNMTSLYEKLDGTVERKRRPKRSATTKRATRSRPKAKSKAKPKSKKKAARKRRTAR